MLLTLLTQSHITNAASLRITRLCLGGFISPWWRFEALPPHSAACWRDAT